MTTISLKISETLLCELESEARRRGVSKSELLRDAVQAKLRRRRSKKQETCLDRMGDLVGSFHGPSDLSTNRRYLAEAIKSRARRSNNAR
jgi:hypothetical protein